MIRAKKVSSLKESQFIVLTNILLFIDVDDEGLEKDVAEVRIVYPDKQMKQMMTLAEFKKVDHHLLESEK